MRGKAVQKPFPDEKERITPAHAGKSKISVTDCMELADHPRTCGEKVSFIFDYAANGGSPPHMRGKEVQNAPLYL